MLLVIEVADTSLNLDRSIKGPLYARAGIVEFWLVDIRRRQIEIYREPSADGYQWVTTARPGDEVELVALPGIRLAVGELLGGGKTPAE